MVNRSNQPFHRQLTHSFILALILFALVSALVAALLYLQQQENNYLQNQQLPQLAQAQQYQRILRAANSTIDHILVQQSAAQFPALHQSLDKTMSKLRYSPYKNAVLSRNRFYESGNVEVNLNRLARSAEKNTQLQRLSITQFQQLLERLAIEILNKEVKQQQLYHQIANDRANDRVTANRARTYAILTKKLSVFHQLNDLLNSINNDLLNLTIQSSLLSFESFNEKILAAFKLYQQLITESLIANEALKIQFDELEKLLLTEQRTLSKWRGHLRIAQPYLSGLALQKTQLVRAIEQAVELDVIATVHLQHPLHRLLSQYQINVTHHELFQGLLILAGLFAILLVSTLLRIRRQVKSHGQDSVILCQQLQGNPQVELTNFLSLEHRQIFKLVNEINKPAHSEHDYQYLLTEQYQQAEFIQQYANVVFWSSAQNMADNKLLVALLFSEQEQQQYKVDRHWRSWFDSHHYKMLSVVSRKAKHQQQPQTVQVFALNGKALLVTVGYRQGCYFGCVENINKRFLLEQQLAQLSDINEQQEHNLVEVRTEQYQRVQKTAINSLLQNQSVLVNAGIPSLKVHRRLVKMLASNEQDLIYRQLQDANYSLQLTDFNFRDKLHGAVFNAMFVANIQKNRVLLQCEGKITDKVRLDAQLFVQLINSVSNSLLAEQFSSTLLLACQLADKNSGQQIIRITATVYGQKTLKQLPEILALFVSQNEQALADDNSAFAVFIQALFSALHITNVQTSFNDHSYQLSFDLPIATVNNGTANNEEKHTPNLATKHLVLLADDELTQTLVKNAITGVKAQAAGQFKILTDYHDLVAQLNNQNLAANPIDVIVLSAEQFAGAFVNIEQAIADLTADLQPKIMVMQPFFNASLARQGLYSQANTPLSEQSFLLELQTLLKSDKASNCLIEQKQFAQYRPSATPSEILVALAAPEQHQVLLRILQWLGLQITVVTDADAYQKQWQSGRYLLLLTEFKQSPCIGLTAGQGIARGIFYFSEQPFSLLTTQESKIAEKWLITPLPALENISALIELLKPWLTLANTVKSTVPDWGIGHTDEQLKVEVESTPANNTIDDEGDNKPDHIELSDTTFADLSLEEFDQTDVNAVFDIGLYAANQGSPELAAYMLSSYVDELHQYFADFTASIEKQQFNEAESVLEKISLVAKIMAADDLIDSSQQLSMHLQQKKPEISIEKLKQLQIHIQAVDDYAEAI